MKPIRFLSLLPLCWCLVSSAVQAEPAAWLSVTAGPAWLQDHGADWGTPHGLLEVSSGLGTSPFRPIVFGGIIRSSTLIGSGTDLSLLGRGATRGYALGDWGGALDLGGYERFWGETSAGFTGSLNLGAPFGIVAALGGQLGTGATRGLTATLGFDFARLTVFRTSGENWWKNPFPPTGETQAKAP